MKIIARSAVLLIALLCSGMISAKSDVKIAITFDDLPLHNDLPPGTTRQQIVKEIAVALKSAHAPKVYGFVNAVHLQNDPTLAAVFTDWRATGFSLGNHTWSHANLNDLTVEEFTEEILKDEDSLKQYAKGTDWHWFRYPYLAEGKDEAKRKAIRDLLAQHGYHIAAVTMSFSDYAWNGPYARCVAKADEQAIKLLEKNYLLVAAEAIEQSHTMSNILYNRDIPYVLLMHVGGFDAHMMPRLLAMYKAKGVKLITLQDAEKDSAYASDFNPSLPADPAGLEARMWARKLAVPGGDLSLTSILNTICK